jgi:hypothetical protein
MQDASLEIESSLIYSIIGLTDMFSFLQNDGVDERRYFNYLKI